MSDVSSPMPAVFIGHGNPMNALGDNRYSRAWRALGDRLPRPRAILSISAHWYTHGSFVTTSPRPRTIHDFRGFPQPLYEVSYPAPGDPGLAERVRGLLGPEAVRGDRSWGLDHGSWSVLVHAYPQARVPVVQLSIDADAPGWQHYELGRCLAPLRDDGVLVIGSGNVVHNLRTMNWDEAAPALPWAQRFNELVRECLVHSDHEALCDWHALDHADQAVPTPDHYLPLLYVIGLQRDAESVSFPVDGIEHGSVGMLSVVVGGK
ncbi:4,5-DOPA dioxygenase extradiol [Arhodomonas sp. AD133]|uniref:4,5-DOPA-extradiol-dioxygenase n=1 Tax=Arhodomonas sp. AD133 TaxID=3415009 RepID=UPI003EB7DBC1